MDAIFIRHGKAGDRDPARWPDDDLRPLTREGAAEMKAVCRALRRLGVTFEFLVTSPLLRARQTAEVVAAAYDWKEPPQEADVLGHDCTGPNVVKLLARFPPDATVALVGHEPALSRLVAQFIGRSGDAAIELKKGGVAGVEWEGPAALGTGTLSFVLKPGQLRKLSRSKP